MGRRRRRRGPDRLELHDVVAGADLVVHGLEAELRAAAEALERAAYVLRDRAELLVDANAAMTAATRARQALPAPEAR